MSVVVRKNNPNLMYYFMCAINYKSKTKSTLTRQISRPFSDDKHKGPSYSCSTILVENGFNVQELPVVVRKATELETSTENSLEEVPQPATDSHSYHLIQAEFKECLTLRDVFALLSKCNKITPNIALAAMERIYDLQKTYTNIEIDPEHINVAKDAIVEKLLKVVTTTEDTQSILNALNTVSTFIEPYKYKLCDEILLRVIDNKLSLKELCEFTQFLVSNKTDAKYNTLLDNLWVGFVEREHEIDETNILLILNLSSSLRKSKKTMLNLVDQKLAKLWYKLSLNDVQEILNVFVIEKYWTPHSSEVIGRWLNTNIHILDEDSLLEILTKFTKINYTDSQIEKAVERYMKSKGSKIVSPMLIVGILNFCMKFQMHNHHILNGCAEYFVTKGNSIPFSFIQSIVFPFGFLNFEPKNADALWAAVDEYISATVDKFSIDDLSSIILSYLYSSRYPIELVNQLFNTENIIKTNNDKNVMRKLLLIDTAMSLECENYIGPLLAKDQFSASISQDARVKKIIIKIKDSIVKIAGGSEMVSTPVFVPHLYFDATYLIDLMIHPIGVKFNSVNWKMHNKSENIAVLIHLPEHYCTNDILIGPQEMRIRHLRKMGVKVVSLSYSLLCKYQNKDKKSELLKYLVDCIKS